MCVWEKVSCTDSIHSWNSNFLCLDWWLSLNVWQKKQLAQAHLREWSDTHPHTHTHTLRVRGDAEAERDRHNCDSQGKRYPTRHRIFDIKCLLSFQGEVRRWLECCFSSWGWAAVTPHPHITHLPFWNLFFCKQFFSHQSSYSKSNTQRGGEHREKDRDDFRSHTRSWKR